MPREKKKASLNELLVSLFNSIMTTEAQAVVTDEFSDITENDLHILEAIGLEENRKMSDIAKKRDITVGTITTNVSNLEKKGYVSRTRSEKDKRVVFVKLTQRGKKAYYHHRDFHKKMIKTVAQEFDEDEKEILMRCLQKLSDFFINYKG